MHYCRGLVWLLFIALFFPITGCEDEDSSVEKANCGDWTYSLTKTFADDELVACQGRYTPSCYLNDGTLVNDENLDAELSWDFSVNGDLTLLSVVWSMWGTTSTAVFEADVVDGKCGEGTIQFIVDDGADLDGCAAIEVNQVYWDSASEIHD